MIKFWKVFEQVFYYLSFFSGAVGVYMSIWLHSSEWFLTGVFSFFICICYFILAQVKLDNLERESKLEDKQNDGSE
jgi:hypothetical protein